MAQRKTNLKERWRWMRERVANVAPKDARSAHQFVPRPSAAEAVAQETFVHIFNAAVLRRSDRTAAHCVLHREPGVKR